MMTTAKNYRWYTPLIELLGASAYFLLFLFLLVPVFLIWVFVDPAAGGALASAEFDLTNPIVLFSMLAFIGIATPAIVLAARWPGRRGSTIFSVIGRMRWALAARACGVTALVTIGIIAAQFFEYMVRTGELLSFTFDRNALFLVAIVVLVVPFQAAAEELLFRGLLPQVAGAWGAPAWLVYMIPAPLFIIGHEYNWIGLLDIAVFAVAMALLTHRSGGLELAIGVHVTYNTLVMLTGAIGMADMNATEIHWATVLINILGTMIITAVLLRALPRHAGTPEASLSADKFTPRQGSQPNLSAECAARPS